MNDKSQLSDGPGQREHSVTVSGWHFMIIGEKRSLFIEVSALSSGVCNLKKVNYFFLVPLGIQEEVIYLIMSRHPASTMWSYP